jgi:predicted acyltransferase
MDISQSSSEKGRLMSLDALRGLDMLFLTAIGGILIAAGKSYDNSFVDALANQCQHTEWIGLHAWDLIFPLFIFAGGVSLPFAMNKRLKDGHSRQKLYIHIIRRAMTLFFLGLLMSGLLRFDFQNMHYTGVLQRIAIAYFCSAIIVINTGIRTQAVVTVSLLVVYWLLMLLVPVPGFGAGVFTPEGNLHTFIDQLLLPGNFYNNQPFDEDGILQQISSIAVCLAGVLAGHWLRSSISGNKKVIGLLAAGTAAILTALIWSLSFPIIFRLWSSSYALLASGISSILLGLFYWLIDVKGYRKWAFPFVIAGMNAITIYIAPLLIDFNKPVNFLVSGFTDYLGSFKPVFFALCILIVKWLFLYFLYMKKIFLKV